MKRTVRGVLWVATVALFAAGVVGAVTVRPKSGTTAATRQLSDAEVIANVHDAAASAPSMAFHVNVKTTTEDGSFAFDMDGISEAATRRSSVTEHIPLPNGALTLHLLSADAHGYVEVPPARRAAAKGKQWLAFDLSSFQPTKALPQSSDPLAALNVFKQPGSQIDKVGRETVGGASATHYRIDVNVKAIANSIPALQQMTQQLPAGVLPETFPVDLWVDAHGLPRQLLEKIDVDKANIVLQMTFGDFGTAPPITIPAPADALPVASLQDAIVLLIGR